MQPVVLCLDDMHWADASTTDLLAYLARRIDSTRLLIITTCRPSELAQSRHPFLPVKLDLIARGMCRDLRPGSLDLLSIAPALGDELAPRWLGPIGLTWAIAEAVTTHRADVIVIAMSYARWGMPRHL